MDGGFGATLSMNVDDKNGDATSSEGFIVTLALDDGLGTSLSKQPNEW